MTSNILRGKYRFILMVCSYDDFHKWMELVEALLGASKPSRSCSALTWAILCRIQFASLFDIWPLWFGQKLIMQPMHITFHGKIMEKSNVFIKFQVSKLLLLGKPSVHNQKHFSSSDAGILSAHAGSWAGGFFISIVTSLINDQNYPEFD